MRLKSFLILILLLTKVQSENPITINTYNRKYQSLNGYWKYIVDPQEAGYYNFRGIPYDRMATPSKAAFFTYTKPDGFKNPVEYDFDKSDSLYVPGDWNSQKDRLFYYEGSIWYKKSFNYEKKKRENRVFLCFDAINYRAEVYLNGEKLGIHEGGFTPFAFEITTLLKQKDNYLIIKVDNTRRETDVPPLSYDWWNYGGITRDVKLIETPITFIQDYFIYIDPKNKNIIKGLVKIAGSNRCNTSVELRIPELKIKRRFLTDSEGNGEINIEIGQRKINFWSPENPYLYRLIVKCEEDELVDSVGFRTISTKGGKILLNDNPIFLKGINIHEENPLRGGRAFSNDDAKLLLGWAKELGCNFVRIAHYPHNQNMIRMAEKIGLLVWEEIPVYWNIAWKSPSAYQIAERQLTEMILRDRNRACTIIWSITNESPDNDERYLFLQRLIRKARQLDATRLISGALNYSISKANPNLYLLDDNLANLVDVISFNEYVGWYDGLPDKCKQVQWIFYQEKPVIISEFGAGAKQGFHADSLTRWSEEYQEYVYKENIKMLQKIKYLSGISPWVLFDFRSPRRFLPFIQDGWNRKGLISSEGKKKKAFHVLKNFYESIKDNY